MRKREGGSWGCGVGGCLRGLEYFYGEVMVLVSLALSNALLTVWPVFYPLISFPSAKLDVAPFEAECSGPLKHGQDCKLHYRIARWTLGQVEKKQPRDVCQTHKRTGVNRMNSFSGTPFNRKMSNFVYTTDEMGKRYLHTKTRPLHFI